jgi:hypothetical protein
MPSARITHPRHSGDNRRSVTIADIVRRLGVTLVTAYAWRRGSARRDALPHSVMQYGRSVRVVVNEGDLVNWLSEYRPDLLQLWQPQ